MVKNKHLSKAITDVAWSEFIRQLEYKCEWKGKTLIKIDKWFSSSQLCSNYGANRGKKPLHIRKWTCPECGYTHNRDLNAAINVRNYGIGQLDNRHRAGTVQIQACGESSGGAIKSSYGRVIVSQDSMKQEAPAS